MGRPHIAFDIETTGLAASDEVVSIAVYDEQIGGTVLAQDPGGQPNSETIDAMVNYYDSEYELLNDGLSKLVENRALLNEHADDFSDVGVLVGFNAADSYRGAFDVPHLRTRCAIQGIEWPLKGVQILDLMDPMKNYFQTNQYSYDGFNKDPLKEFGRYIGLEFEDGAYKRHIRDKIEQEDPDTAELSSFATDTGKEVPTSSVGSLDGLVEMFCDFEPEATIDGENVPQLFEDGRIVPIVRHNIDDVKATRELYETFVSYMNLDNIHYQTL